MSLSVFQRQLLGLDENALLARGRHKLQPAVWNAWTYLSLAAEKEGYKLQIASAYRSYERQLSIWNGKLSGERPVLDDNDHTIDIRDLSDAECIRCVLRFSAMPGGSRHHWGTDLDVYDAAAVADDYRVQLSAAEVDAAGPFGAMHAWLDQRIARGESFGFYRPYDRDRGGVAAERWHLSYAPLATDFECAIDESLLRRLWRGEGGFEGNSEGNSEGKTAVRQPVAREALERELESIFERFVLRVARPPAAALAYLPPD
ncbi:M15 family metallopeptidase [Congregibacter sp.]|uniref:M15 family metallopeptidase n=1 Tax=Congregibacter sp. TaxID=2744308 RepID=UPI003F6A7A30